MQRELAWQLAPIVGVDLWEAGFAHLAANPLDAGLYWKLLRTNEVARIQRVLAFAEEHLPLAKIASGPGVEMGLGPGYEAHHCLDFLVQEMRREEVFSSLLVAAALRSPVLRNRNMAATALESHPVATWDEAVRAALQQAADEEPGEELRARLQDLTAKT
jgi:hypothetical protein